MNDPADSIILTRETQQIAHIETEVAVMNGCEHIIRHSPSGIEWGYEGSGPADCARSILIHFVGSELAEGLYQQFKREVIGRVPREGAELHKLEILKWVASRLEIADDAALVETISANRTFKGWAQLPMVKLLIGLAQSTAIAFERKVAQLEGDELEARARSAYEAYIGNSKGLNYLGRRYEDEHGLESAEHLQTMDARDLYALANVVARDEGSTINWHQHDDVRQVRDQALEYLSSKLACPAWPDVPEYVKESWEVAVADVASKLGQS